MQVLPAILANICKFEGEKGDVLVEWVTALLEWILKTVWNKRPDDLSLRESDELLWILYRCGPECPFLEVHLDSFRAKNARPEYSCTSLNR